MQLHKILNLIITLALLVVVFLFFQIRGDLRKQRDEFRTMIKNYELVAEKQKEVIDGMDRLSKTIGEMAVRVNSLSGGIGKVNQKIGGVKDLIEDSKSITEESAKLLGEQQTLLESLRKASKAN
jgi:methyl-accepting chemotaxis protein